MMGACSLQSFQLVVESKPASGLPYFLMHGYSLMMAAVWHPIRGLTIQSVVQPAIGLQGGHWSCSGSL
jgi:hypothetical protein